MVYDHFTKIRNCALLIDALGMTVFSFIGAQKAGNAGLGCVGMILFASITAVGGGILADIITGDKPIPFTCEMYVPGCCLYWRVRSGQARGRPCPARWFLPGVSADTPGFCLSSGT